MKQNIADSLNKVFHRIFCVSLLLIAGFAYSLTPIARWDIVPYQRLNVDSTLNVGVVAFSKADIKHVSFTVSGQGYSGTNPLKVSNMALNPETNVYEYWVPIKSQDFSSDGVFSISAEVVGKDDGVRNLEALSFVVNKTGALPSHRAWVSKTGSDSTGKINSKSNPFRTVSAALNSIQAVNSGSSDGATINLLEGSYSLGNGSVSTTNEWVTIARDQEARRDYTVIVDASSVVSTKYMEFRGLTIQGSSSGSAYFSKRPATIWINGCVISGGGRYVAGSNPTIRSGSDENEYPAYVTDTEMYDVDFGMQRGLLARNVTIKRTGNDPFVNVMCIINAVVDDVDPGSTYWHADGYQSWGPGPKNRIIYGYYGTSLHYQGLFMRQTVGNPGTNNAFVNMFLEMREPGRQGSSGGSVILKAGTLNGAWEHLLIWHCSFLGGAFTVYDDPDGTPLSFTNCSFIGNVFFQYIDYEGTVGENPEYSKSGNSGNNEFLFNHYIYSNVDQGGGGEAPPHWYSMSPDSGTTTTHSYGDAKINLSLSAAPGIFGVPYSDSLLLDTEIDSVTDIDALGRLRDEYPDIGALEKSDAKPIIKLPDIETETDMDKIELRGIRLQSVNQ